ncbi:MAG: N-acetyltransferase [Candidatus Omnitrophica bacterium]|nr:N-acetyltransferase [Candidatus Omnitrophota bacterium]
MIRKATITDAKKIRSLIQFWAKKGKVLDRSLNYIYENIRDFWIYQEKNKVIGCCALHVVGWDNLAEIKALVVNENYHRKGVGDKLVIKCLKEAGQLQITAVFALTFVPEFFKKIGFRKTSRNKLPHKIWSDCVNCNSFPDCNEEAMIFKLRR